MNAFAADFVAHVISANIAFLNDFGSGSVAGLFQYLAGSSATDQWIFPSGKVDGARS